jgi:uncharacterized repeat protein (TIGR03806 family)
MHTKRVLGLAWGAAIFALILESCFWAKNTPAHPASLDFGKFPLKQLSEYGFFKGNIAHLDPSEGVLLYEPAATLFSDYSFKKRFVWMPRGQAATFDPDEPNRTLVFPDQTILVKNFYYPADFAQPEGQRRLIETRLLVKQEGKWKAYPYRWNEAQTDAQYKVTGETVPVAWKDEKGEIQRINYSVPNKNQCKSCHNYNDDFVPIGPKVKQLNHAIAYADGAENQLSRWTKMGYLKAKAEDIAKIKPLVGIDHPSASLDAKARSYLDVNCGHCHNRQGPASTSGLYLHIEEQNPFHWGVMKSPVAAGMGAGNFKFDVYPGHGKASILSYRMNSVHPGIMMPEVGRVSIHHEGVALIENWINSLDHH